MALINKLSDIAEAVRERSGYTGGLTLEDMAIEIKAIPYPVVEEIEITENGTYEPPEGVDGFNKITVATTGSIEVEPIVLSGDCEGACSGQLAENYINLCGNTISTKDITNASYMFENSSLTEIPFDINFKEDNYSASSGMFVGCNYLTTLPKMINLHVVGVTQLFGNCLRLREIPEDFVDTWKWDRLHEYAYANAGSTFWNCYSLRKIPQKMLKELWNKQTSAYSSCYYSLIQECYALDEAIGIAVSPTSYTANVFGNTFNSLFRIKELIFDTNEDGTVKTAPWKNQNISLKGSIGYFNGLASAVGTYLIDYNSGITADKQVKDDATYQALKNNPDWFTCKIDYSRYNHDSAVNTINSLPDTSAYLATAGGTNTITFQGASGALTDGGAINTLTEEEIAVAAAKGWTVSLV